MGNQGGGGGGAPAKGVPLEHRGIPWFFLNLHKTNQSINLNFSGNLKISLNEISNRLFENLIINVSFLDEKISLNNSSLNLKKIGKINFSDPHNTSLKSD